MSTPQRPARQVHFVDDPALIVSVTGAPGAVGEVRVNSKFDRPTTAALLRQIADDYANRVTE